MVYLGSKSPRRHELLKSIVQDFEVIHKDVDESFDLSEDLNKVPIRLAEKKFKSIISDLQKHDILITADTVVIKEGLIYNKPEDEHEASQMISQLMGGYHSVITGVVVGNQANFVSFSDFTSVYMDVLTDAELKYYVNSFTPFDKAGGYGIQDWIGMAKISKIEGSYANVMGLPTQKLYEVIKDNFTQILKG
jgi:septum formation protein